jgi:hypothetical protein
MNAGRARNLGEVHGAELAGADEADAHGPVFGGALLEFGMKTHVVVIAGLTRNPCG